MTPVASYIILVGKPIGRLTCRWDDNNKNDFKETICVCVFGLDTVWWWALVKKPMKFSAP
jgi:hypothetical protein